MTVIKIDDKYQEKVKKARKNLNKIKDNIVNQLEVILDSNIEVFFKNKIIDIKELENLAAEVIKKYPYPKKVSIKNFKISYEADKLSSEKSYMIKVDLMEKLNKTDKLKIPLIYDIKRIIWKNKMSFLFDD